MSNEAPHLLYCAKTREGFWLIETMGRTRRHAISRAANSSIGGTLLDTLPRQIRKWTDSERWQALKHNFGWSVILVQVEEAKP